MLQIATYKLYVIIPNISAENAASFILESAPCLGIGICSPASSNHLLHSVGTGVCSSASSQSLLHFLSSCRHSHQPGEVR